MKTTPAALTAGTASEILDILTPINHETGRIDWDEVGEELHPGLADEAKTAQFLAGKWEVLTPAAMTLFLDAVFREIGEAVNLLRRRAYGDSQRSLGRGFTRLLKSVFREPDRSQGQGRTQNARRQRGTRFRPSASDPIAWLTCLLPLPPVSGWRDLGRQAPQTGDPPGHLLPARTLSLSYPTAVVGVPQRPIAAKGS